MHYQLKGQSPPNTPKGMIEMAHTTTTDMAVEFGTTPRNLRKFLRSEESGIAPVGKGARYALPGSKREMTALRKRFDSWTEAREAAKVEAETETDTPDEE